MARVGTASTAVPVSPVRPSGISRRSKAKVEWQEIFSCFHLIPPNSTSGPPRGGGGAVMRFGFRILDFGFATQGGGGAYHAPNLEPSPNLNRNPNPGAGLPMHQTAFLAKTVKFADCPHFALCILHSAFRTSTTPFQPASAFHFFGWCFLNLNPNLERGGRIRIKIKITRGTQKSEMHPQPAPVRFRVATLRQTGILPAGLRRL
jgi:hypothetical protein